MASMLQDDYKWMEIALACAQQAELEGEVPVGAVIVHSQQLIGKGWNRPIQENDPTSHAEINALRSACRQVENYRIPESTLYATLEPCVMCAGAIVHARIQRVVFACADLKSGAAGSVYSILGTDHNQLNHSVAVTSGVMEKEASTLLKNFFRQRR